MDKPISSIPAGTDTELTSQNPVASEIDGPDAQASSSATQLHPAAGSHGSQATQRDYLQLLLAQERRLDNLEQENRKLLTERDVLNEKYQAQLQLVEALTVLQGVDANKPAATKAASKPVQRDIKKRAPLKNVRPKNTSQTSVTIEELPMIDASEFQPAQPVLVESVVDKGRKAVTDVTTVTASTVKTSAVWCGKKIVSILT